MGTSTPKQYLPLSGKPIALHSFDLFCDWDEIDEIVVVCAPSFRSFFSRGRKPIQFADPGKRRQDSIFSGFQKTSSLASVVCTHDSARPFVEHEVFLSLLEKTLETGAATLAAPVISTIKQSNASHIVDKTLDRSNLWEIQTPQAMRRDLFTEGIERVSSLGITVTDDVALAELLQKTVAVVPSPHRNFKITTPFDLALAKTLLCAIN